MSGGHYNYFYFKVMEFTEQIKEDAGDIDDLAVKNLMMTFAKQLEKVEVRARAIEWYMSGDYSEDALFKIFTNN